MANRLAKDIRVRLDTLSNSTGALTNITAYLNQVALQRALAILEDTGLNETNKSILFGLAGTTITLNGHINTTTEAIFGPLVNAATSVLKTLEYRAYPTNTTGNIGRFYFGEVLVSNVQISGAVGGLQVFSADLTFDGAVTRTTVQTTYP